MKRSTLIGALLLGSGAIGAMLLAPGCSSSSSGGGTTADTDTGTPSGDTGAPYTRIIPPERPSTRATGGGTKWFAVKALKLGITNKTTGKSDPNAWKDFGFDLDQRNTTADDSKTSANSCKRVSGSPSGILADGNGGIDNNFGGHVMATIKSLKSDAEDAVNQSVTDGKFTLILKLDNVPASGDGDGVTGSIYVANNFNDGKSAPKFDATDTWKINTASLSDGATISKPKLAFPKGYVSKGYWVSGDFGTGTINLDISLSGAEISLPIDAGVIVVKLADGSDGTIAGAMNKDKLQNALTPVAKKFGICPGNATYEQVVSTLTQSADLVSGAPLLQDTSKECDAISIAIGFQMSPTGEPKETMTSPTTTGPDDCSGEGAGADGG